MRFSYPAGDPGDLRVGITLLAEFGRHAVFANLVDLVDRGQHIAVTIRRDRNLVQPRGNELPVIDTDHEIVESERRQDLRHRGDLLGFDNRRSRSHAVDVALVELAEAAARGPIGAPYRLNLVALEEP